jgi:asparagine synthase (glutamine-hydrolysing)
MCGFVAILQDSNVIDLISARRALDEIAHRGPDAAGEWRDSHVFMGHRRLSIIDLTTGDQPMQSSDGRFVIVFNGEIYNFPELRELLIGRGAVFRTRSDTEVILEGYRYWGENVVNHLHGMFAFVIWDRTRSCAFGARDRLGIKPLCWAMYNGALIVSSTLESFGVLGKFDQLDPLGIRDLMAFDYIATPRSIFKEVCKLEPATQFKWHFGSPTPTFLRYWYPPLSDSNLSVPDEFALEDLVDRAVKRQMISDVPIGVFLSGGIDSSLIVAMMARHSSGPVRTFAVRFSEGNVDESPIAKVVAQHFGTDHTVLYAEDVGPDMLLELLGRLDEPFCDPALIPTYALSKLTKCHVKVALSGDGGDEVFGGYPKYLLPKIHRGPQLPLASLLHRTLQAVPWRPGRMSHIYWRTLSANDLIRYSWSRYGDFPIFCKDMRQLLTASYQKLADIKGYFDSWERRARRYGDEFNMDVIMRADLETYLSENCLVKTDRASMLASLEVRVPYLDETILDRILPVPTCEKIRGRQLKALLLPIAQRLLPREVWDRPKHGFDVPLHIRLSGSWRPALESALDWGESNVPIFNYRYLWRLHRINLADGGINRELWNPFVFLAWAMSHPHSL